MSIRFTCPKCAQRLTLTASKPGDWIDCPACEATVQIPGPAPAPEPDELEPDFDPDPERKWWADRQFQAVAVAGIAAVVIIAALGFALTSRKSKPPAETVAAVPTAPVPVPSQPAPEPVRPKVDPPNKVAANVPAPAPVVSAPPEIAPPPHVPRPRSRVALIPVAVAHAEARALKLGVNPSGSDDVGAVLRGLGKGYEYADLTAIDLESGDRLKKYDVVFLNCGGPVGNNQPRALAAVREFVFQGGTLYASDWQYEFVCKAFPAVSNRPAMRPGDIGDYKAEVLDDGLQRVLGKSVELKFNLGGWKTAAFSGKAVSVLLRADGSELNGAPLLVKFTHGKGTVFYTSFHNSAIADDTAKKLLRHLVFSAVVADAESRINEALVRDKYVIKSSEILSAPSADWSATRSHTFAKGETFRVAVGFRNDNAEVALTLTSPEGEDVTFERSGTDAFAFDVLNAPPGEWKLKVTARKIPNPNFPITLVVAEPN